MSRGIFTSAEHAQLVDFAGKFEGDLSLNGAPNRNGDAAKSCRLVALALQVRAEYLTYEYKTATPSLVMGRPRLFDLDAAIGSALEVFWQHGYAAATPAELLEAIGVGKGSFYNAFESKHAIFEQALRRYGDDRVSGLARALSGAGSVRQRLTRYLGDLAAPQKAVLLRRGCLAANTAAELGGRDPVATEVVRETFQRMERVIEATFTEAQQRGELARSLDAKSFATLLLAALVGITVLARVDEPGTRVRRIARAFAALL